jgi:hypothetical protein
LTRADWRARDTFAMFRRVSHIVGPRAAARMWWRDGGDVEFWRAVIWVLAFLTGSIILWAAFE